MGNEEFLIFLRLFSFLRDKREVRNFKDKSRKKKKSFQPIGEERISCQESKILLYQMSDVGRHKS